MTAVEERFWSKVDTSGDCWLWAASLNHDGYGQFRYDDRCVAAHRIAWLLTTGSLPPRELELDHLCRVRRCVNPAHLQPVSHQENCQRGQLGVNAYQRLKTHCPRGHSYDEENTYIRIASGHEWRSCRACNRESHRRSHDLTREARP